MNKIIDLDEESEEEEFENNWLLNMDFTTKERENVKKFLEH